MIVSITVITKGVLVDDAALALPRCISYPDTPNTNIAAFSLMIELLPERFI
jgi:hypothetical protein